MILGSMQAPIVSGLPGHMRECCNQDAAVERFLKKGYFSEPSGLQKKVTSA